MAEKAPFFAVAAEFASGADLLEAASRISGRGWGLLHAYTPLPVPGLAEVLGEGGGSVRLAAIVRAAAGTVGFFGLQVYATTADYVFLIGGRPFLSWPYFVIPSISVGMLVGTLAATLAMLFLSRLPRLNHPAFNIDGFERATTDRFFLTVEPAGDGLDVAAIEQALRQGAPPIRLTHVPR